MAKSGITVFFLLMLVVMAATMPNETTAAISCGMVYHGLSPCLGYLTNKVGLRLGCCNGIRLLSSAARTTGDRRTACKCLKNAASNIRNLNFRRAAGLPNACGVKISYKISPRTDCSRVR